MWAINSIQNNTSPQQPVSFSDGDPIGQVRGPEGASFRLLVGNLGYLDFTDTGHQPGGPHYWQIVIGIDIYWYDGQGAIDLTLNNDGSFSISGDGNQFAGRLTPFPVVNASDVATLDQMIKDKYVPYQNIPDEPGKTTEQLKELGKQYFPLSPSSFELAMAVYDWTTADFTRIDFMNLFTYTGVSGEPLDANSVTDAIWTANWPPYTPQNKDYMNSFMMVPANTRQEVADQLSAKEAALRKSVAAETNLIRAATTAMPRTSTIAKPQLFSGQVAIANLGTDHFATYFSELPQNSDSSLPPLDMPLAHATAGFLSAGNTVTLKTFMAFTDSLDGAQHYSNGIVVIVSPPDGAVIWEDTTYITPLSDGPEKTEYLFPPGTQFRIQKVETVTISGKSIVEIHAQVT